MSELLRAITSPKIKVIRTCKTFPRMPKEVELELPELSAKLINVKFGWLDLTSSEERAGKDHYYVEAYWEIIEIK